MATTIRSADFIGTLGVNTHIDFAAYGYQNLSVVEAAITYLGLQNLRDSPQSASDAGPQGSWQQVASQTHAKFDAYIPQGSPANMQASLNLIPQLASQGILNYLEGGDEEDDTYAASLGNTLTITANFQKSQLWPMGQQLGLPVINMSFGAGWTAANGWTGDYAAVGDLSAYANYGNAHTFPVSGQTPDSTIQRINGLAKLADSADPVITTEIGWDRNQGYTQLTVAKYVLDATMDGVKDGDVKMYFYALFDDGAGDYGLMNQNGTPMPAGTALHNLTTLLSDTGTNASTFITGTLGYSLSNTTSNDNSLLLEKSDGTYWISIWNEVDSPHNVTVTLSNAVAEIKTFDPLNGTNATQDLKGATAVTVALTDHPLLVEVIPSNSPSPPPPPTLQPNDLTVNVPVSGDTVQANTTSPLSGVSVSDPWAAQNPGLMALNLWDRSGAPLYVNGQQVTGRLYVTLNQLNADLLGLSYGATASGSDTVTVDVWNQAGVEATASFGVTIATSPSPPPPPPPPTLTPTDLVVNIPASGDTVRAMTTSALPGASVSDPWAAQNPGLMALNLWDSSDAPLYVNGQQVTGTLYGTLDQLNADLRGLTYKAGTSGSDTVTVDVWNQAGVERTASFGVTIAAAASPLAVATSISSNRVGNSGTQMSFIGGSDHPAIGSGGLATGPAASGSNAEPAGTSEVGRSGSDTTSEPKMTADGDPVSALVLEAAQQGTGFGIQLFQSGNALDQSNAAGTAAFDDHPLALASGVCLDRSGIEGGPVSGIVRLAHAIG